MATHLSIGIILWVGLRPTQLFFYAARERMTAQNPPATGTQPISHCEVSSQTIRNSTIIQDLQIIAILLLGN